MQDPALWGSFERKRPERWSPLDSLALCEETLGYLRFLFLLFVLFYWLLLLFIHIPARRHRFAVPCSIVFFFIVMNDSSDFRLCVSV
jgi:hypothetical protein